MGKSLGDEIRQVAVNISHCRLHQRLIDRSPSFDDRHVPLGRDRRKADIYSLGNQSRWKRSGTLPHSGVQF